MAFFSPFRPGTLQLVENRPTKKGEGGGRGKSALPQKKCQTFFVNIFLVKSAKALFYNHVIMITIISTLYMYTRTNSLVVL